MPVAGCVARGAAAAVVPGLCVLCSTAGIGCREQGAAQVGRSATAVVVFVTAAGPSLYFMTAPCSPDPGVVAGHKLLAACLAAAIS